MDKTKALVALLILAIVGCKVLVVQPIDDSPADAGVPPGEPDTTPDVEPDAVEVPHMANAMYTQARADIISGALDITSGLEVQLIASLEPNLTTFPTFDASHTHIADVTGDVGYLVSGKQSLTSVVHSDPGLDAADMTGEAGWSDATYFPFRPYGEWISAFVVVKGTVPIAWFDATGVRCSNAPLPLQDVDGNKLEIYWNASGIFDEDTGEVFTPSICTNQGIASMRYDAAVVEWAESTIRTHLPATIEIANQQIVGNASWTDVTIPTPESMAVQARSEGDLAERGHRPQHTEGVWCRVTNSIDHGGLAFQPQTTEHTLIVYVFATSTDAEDATPATTQPTGYKRVAWLARAVDVALNENYDCPNYGVFYAENRGGNRIPRALRGMPSTHFVTLTFTVLQKTHRPLGVA